MLKTKSLYRIAALLIFTAILIQPFDSKGQAFTWSLGYAPILNEETNDFVLIDLGWVTHNNLYFKFGLCIGMKDTKGTYYDNIGPSEFKEDIYETGSYYDAFNIGFGYFKDGFHINAIIGQAPRTFYENRHDPTGILDMNGDYHIKYKSKGMNRINLGLEFGLVYSSNIFITAHLATVTGLGGKIGFYLGDVSSNKN